MLKTVASAATTRKIAAAPTRGLTRSTGTRQQRAELEAQQVAALAARAKTEESTPANIKDVYYAIGDDYKDRILSDTCTLYGTRTSGGLLLKPSSGGNVILTLKAHDADVLAKAKEIFTASGRSNVAIVYGVSKYGQKLVFSVSAL